MISLFKDVRHNSSHTEMSVSDFLSDIKNGKWINEVISFRNGEIEKKSLPAATLSGTFAKRSISGLIEHSGFICIDIDKQNPQTIKNLLKNDIYCYAAWTSISGGGVACLFKINPKKHRESFEGLSEYLYKKYEIIIDQSCRDVCRMRIISYDTEIYINEGAKKFTLYPEKKPTALTKLPKTIFVRSDFDDIINQITSRHIDIVPNYPQWLDCCFALTEQFGEGGRHYFHLISRIGAKYKPDKCDKQFDACLRHKGSGITIGTFYWYCKNSGIEIMSDKTKIIASTATTAWKGSRTIDDTIKLLSEVEGISAEESRDIVNQVFENKIDVKAGDSPIDDLEQWIRQNMDIRLNEVTNKHESNGKVLEDKDYNSFFLDAKRTLPKLEYSLFEKMINSNRIPVYNPIKTWISEHDREDFMDTMALDKLIRTIKSPQPDEYIKFALTKWCAGIMDAIFEKAPPLMLILLGGISTGKTEFFRRLLPDDLKRFHADSKLDEGKDDSILMTQKLIILDDEMAGKSKKESAKFKSISSRDTFSLRRPFGRSNVDLKRLAMICATTNEYEVIERPSENRRMLPIEVESIDYELYNSIEKSELFMDIYYLWKEGEINSTMSKKDIEFLAKNTTKYNAPISEQEMISTFFYPPLPERKNNCVFMTIVQIKHFMVSKSSDFVTLNKLSSYLREMGYKKEFYKGRYGYFMEKRISDEDFSVSSIENDEELPF